MWREKAPLVRGLMDDFEMDSSVYLKILIPWIMNSWLQNYMHVFLINSPLLGKARTKNKDQYNFQFMVLLIDFVDELSGLYTMIMLLLLKSCLNWKRQFIPNTLMQYSTSFLRDVQSQEQFGYERLSFEIWFSSATSWKIWTKMEKLNEMFGTFNMGYSLVN